MRPACHHRPPRRQRPTSRLAHPALRALGAAALVLAFSAGSLPAQASQARQADRTTPASQVTQAAGAPRAAAADAPQKLLLRDRIVAVVDEDPILSSDLDRSITLGLVERKEGESDRAFRRRVLDTLIDQRVRFHEVTRFGLEQVPVSHIDEQVEAIRSRFPSEEDFERRLHLVGLDLDSLHQLVTRQLMVWTYFEEFLGPRIFVSLEDIRQYYEETLTPALKAHNQPVPPIEQVREQIRGVLKEQRLNEAIESRTEELRRDADIVNYFDSEHDSVPPVILEIDKAPASSAGGS